MILTALRDDSSLVREQALRLSEDRLASSPAMLAAVMKLTTDPSSLVRFQLAFSLGASDDPRVVDALAQIVRHDGGDAWVQTAVLTSSTRFASRLLGLLAGDMESRAFTRETGANQRRILTRLAALVGAAHNEADLARTMDLLHEVKVIAPSWRRGILEGLGQGLKNSQSSLSQLWEKPSPALKPAIERTRVYFEQAAATAQDEKQSLPFRLEAVQLLGYGPFQLAAPALQKLLGPQSPVELQSEAVRALSDHESPRVAKILLETWNGYSPIVRREVIEALFAQPARLGTLLDAIEKKQVAAGQIDPFRLDQLRRSRNAEVRRRAEALLASQGTPNRKAIVDEYRPALDLSADAQRGREVFHKTCSTCHRLENIGTEVGPNLIAALRNKSREQLLLDILDPSKEVDPRYLNYVVTTKAGRQLTGLIAVETPSSLTLRRAEKAEDTILRSQIDEIQATPKSLMPEELEKQLNRQDVADVIAYLQRIVTDEPPGASASTASPPFYRDKTRMLVYLDSEGKEHPIANAGDWERRRAHILANMQQVMGPLPDASRKVPLDVKIEEEIKTPAYIRRKVTFAVEKDDRLSAYLFVPVARAGKRPAVLCLHPTSRPLGKGVPAGLGPKSDLAYAVHLAERGYVTLAPDYVKSGDSKFDPYQHGYVSATMKGIWNHMRCIDLLQSLPEVDPERIGVIGHSLGGHNSMYVAAFDPRIKCVVSNCGFCSFPTYMKGHLAGWSHDGYMPRIRAVYETKPEKMPFDFTEVVAALAPRPFLASAPVGDSNFDVEGVKDCITAAKPVYHLLGAEEMLAAIYPDCAHDFPPEVRAVAYAWLDRWLKP
jgi:putative heme-binding domain-containing protein